MDDCVICVLAMVMGPPYTYEKVLIDSQKYAQVSGDGKFVSWWETYLRDKGLENYYSPFSNIWALRFHRGRVVGLLVMENPYMERAHIVAVDEFGIVDPADNMPDHIPLERYVPMRLGQGFRLDADFLVVHKA